MRTQERPLNSLLTLKSFYFFILLVLLSHSSSFVARGETVPLCPIGPSPLTVEQYTAFLQATAATDRYGLYNEKMEDNSESFNALSPCILRRGTPGFYTYEAVPERANDPVPYVSYLSAKRYCNWLQNGEPTGEQGETTTERGAYTLDGTMEENPTREESANFFLPASRDSEIDPSLASSGTTHMILTHCEDSFDLRSFSGDAQEETESWTVDAVIVGAIGIIAATTAALRYRCASPAAHENHELCNLCERREQRRKQPRREAGRYATFPVSTQAPASLADTETKTEQEKTKNMTIPLIVVTSQSTPSSLHWKNRTEKPPRQTSRKTTFTVAEIHEFDPSEASAPSHKITTSLSNQISKIKEQGTKSNESGEPILLDQASHSPSARQKKREAINKLIIDFISSKIPKLPYANTGHYFFTTIHRQISFFHKQIANKNPEIASIIKANNPTLFQQPSLPCWKNENEHRVFFTYLKTGFSEHERIEWKTISSLISRYTIFFELSEAITAWREDVKKSQHQLETLRKNISEFFLQSAQQQSYFSPLNTIYKQFKALGKYLSQTEEQQSHLLTLDTIQEQFKTLAETTFEYLFDFQSYIDLQRASGALINNQTHSLKPEEIETFKRDKESMEQWLANWKYNSKQSTTPLTCSLTPSDLEEKLLSIEKVLNTLSYLSSQNLEEALPFLKFRELTKEVLLIEKLKRSLTCLSQENLEGFHLLKFERKKKEEAL